MAGRCPALRNHGVVTGGETREEATAHIENVIAMILAEMESGGVSPPPDELVPGRILLTIDAGYARDLDNFLGA